MSGKKFFVTRYEKMGWKYEDVKPRQAIRINSINAKEVVVTKRLRSLGIELEKIPFVRAAIWTKQRMELS